MANHQRGIVGAVTERLQYIRIMTSYASSSVQLALPRSFFQRHPLSASFVRSLCEEVHMSSMLLQTYSPHYPKEDR